MSTQLSKDEKDAVLCLLSVRSKRKIFFDEDSYEGSDDVSLCGNIKVRKAVSSVEDDDMESAVSCSEESTRLYLHNQDFIPTAAPSVNLIVSTGKNHPKKVPPMKKMMTCECGATILERTNWKHKQSNKHIQFMLRQVARQNQSARVAHIILPNLPNTNVQSQCSQLQQQTNTHGLSFFDRVGERKQQASSTSPVLLATSAVPLSGPQQSSSSRTNDFTGPPLIQWTLLSDRSKSLSSQLLLDSSSGSIRQQQPQQPLWYIAVPPPPVPHIKEQQPQWQCYRMPVIPETKFFNRDYSASLSNFPIGSSF